MPLNSYPDPLLASVNYVRSALAGRPEPYTFWATVGTKVPDGTVRPEAPYVLVAIDGATSRDRHGTDERAVVRVTVWHSTESSAYALARLVYAVCLAHPGDGTLRSFAPLAAPIPALDPETGQPISTFTLSAQMRPLSL